jgi:hypothetical protein
MTVSEHQQRIHAQSFKLIRPVGELIGQDEQDLQERTKAKNLVELGLV